MPDAIYRQPKMGFVRPGFVSGILDEHFSEQANRVVAIWSLLSLEAWCRTFRMIGGRP